MLFDARTDLDIWLAAAQTRAALDGMRELGRATLTGATIYTARHECPVIVSNLSSAALVAELPICCCCPLLVEFGFGHLPGVMHGDGRGWGRAS